MCAPHVTVSTRVTAGLPVYARKECWAYVQRQTIVLSEARGPPVVSRPTIVPYCLVGVAELTGKCLMLSGYRFRGFNGPTLCRLARALCVSMIGAFVSEPMHCRRHCAPRGVHAPACAAEHLNNQ